VDLAVLGVPVLDGSGRVAAKLSLYRHREMAVAEPSEAAASLTAAATRVKQQIRG
jgi:hypothetical protein